MGSAEHTATRRVSVERELGFVAESVRVPERLIRMSIAAMVPMFGAIAAVMMFSGEGPTSAVTQVVTIVVIASTIPASVVIARANLGPLWWTRRSRPWGVNTVFVLYADIGVSTILFAFTRPEAALFGALLLAIVSVYAVYFCSPAIRNVHMVITTAVITALAVHTWLAGGYNLAATLGRFLVAVAAVNGTVVLQSMFAFGVRKGMRHMLVHAHQDPLTQLWNRRGFAYWAWRLCRAARVPSECSLSISTTSRAPTTPTVTESGTKYCNWPRAA
jgi:two-component system, cell cycle response regulator